MELRPCTLLPPLIGYALLFDVPSHPRNGRRLQFDSYAFDDALLNPRGNGDLYAVLEHNGREVRFAGGSDVLVDADSCGLWVTILPTNNSDGRTAVSLVFGGHTDKMSVRVRYRQSRIVACGSLDIVREASIEEVSAVSDPAIPGTLLRVVDCDLPVPRTRQELADESKRLMFANVLTWQTSGSLRWKMRKAAERAVLLESLSQRESVVI